MSVDIVVIGSINMDLVTRTERLPWPGETLIGKEFHTLPGGKGANQAVAAARLGGSVAMVGRVGSDPFGPVLLDALRQDGVLTDYISVDPTFPTGNASIWVEDSGQNAILVAGGANMQVSPEDVDRAGALIKTARFVVLQFEIPVPAVRRAAEAAREAGAQVVLNAAPANAACLDWLHLVDFLIVNESEAQALSGLPVSDASSGLAAARNLRERGAAVVVLTLGHQGAWWVGEEEGFFPPFNVKAVDTTAAGDAFVGGLVVALCGGQPWQTGMRFASAVGALTVTRLGAQRSLPALADVQTFLA